MAENIARPNRGELITYLLKHHWTKAEAKAFVADRADLLGEATYDDWEDLSIEWVEAQA